MPDSTESDRPLGGAATRGTPTFEAALKLWAARLCKLPVSSIQKVYVTEYEDAYAYSEYTGGGPDMDIVIVTDSPEGNRWVSIISDDFSTTLEQIVQAAHDQGRVSAHLETEADRSERAEVIRRMAEEGPDCGYCIRCDEAKREKEFGIASFMRRFPTCPTCGNKRCPKATWHNNDCTGSNEPGQLGSDYG
jgi:hypothetical protein